MKKSSIMALLLINGLAYMCIWVTPLMHAYYYNAAMEAIGMTHTQIGLLGSLAGFICLVGYIFGGMVADKFKPKTLLLATYAIQFFVTIAYSFFFSYGITVALVIIGSICGAMIYWSAMAKYVRTLGDPTQEGRLYGIHWAFVGIGGTLVGFACSGLIGSFGATEGLRYALYLCAAIMAVAFFTNLFIYKPQEVILSDDEKFKFSNVGKILKMPVFWLAALAALCLYCSSVMTTYAAPMLESNFGVPLVVVSLIVTFRAYLARVIFAPIGGIIVDKTKSSLKLMGILMAVAVIATITMVIIPWNSNALVFAAIIVLVMSIVYCMSIPTWFTPISEIKIPEHMNGTAIGLFSAIFLSADSYMYLIGGRLIDTFGDRMGYIYLYIMLAIIFAIGVVLAYIAYKKIKKLNAAN